MAGVQLDIRITDWRGVQKQLVAVLAMPRLPKHLQHAQNPPCHLPSPGAGGKRVLRVPKHLSSIGGASSDLDQPAWLSSEFS